MFPLNFSKASQGRARVLSGGVGYVPHAVTCTLFYNMQLALHKRFAPRAFWKTKTGNPRK